MAEHGGGDFAEVHFRGGYADFGGLWIKGQETELVVFAVAELERGVAAGLDVIHVKSFGTVRVSFACSGEHRRIVEVVVGGELAGIVGAVGHLEVIAVGGNHLGGLGVRVHPCV